MVMTVTCPSCAASFPVDPAKVPEKGVNARCSSCSQIFRIERPQEEPAETVETPAAEAAAPAPPAEPAAEPEPEPEPEPVAEAEPAPAVPDDADDWVIETEDDMVPTGMDVEPMESAVETADVAMGGFDEPAAAVEEPAAPPAEEEPAPVEPAAEAAPEAAEEEAQPVSAFTFGPRDPADKAKRLARVLVSDMIMYNPDRHERALANGTLEDDFEEEIEKSWKEYVEQVGEEMAESTTFWTEALNDVLAKGQQVF